MNFALFLCSMMQGMSPLSSQSSICIEYFLAPSEANEHIPHSAMILFQTANHEYLRAGFSRPLFQAVSRSFCTVKPNPPKQAGTSSRFLKFLSQGPRGATAEGISQGTALKTPEQGSLKTERKIPSLHRANPAAAAEPRHSSGGDQSPWMRRSRAEPPGRGSAPCLQLSLTPEPSLAADPAAKNPKETMDEPELPLLSSCCPCSQDEQFHNEAEVWLEFVKGWGWKFGPGSELVLKCPPCHLSPALLPLSTLRAGKWHIPGSGMQNS